MASRRPGSPPDPTARLLGESAAIQALRAQIRHLAAFDTLGNPHVPTLLLQGETGTGKGLTARVIHDCGPRAAGPFLEVNCAAIPDTLLEAELFGYEAGAFSDAKRAKPGLFEAASGGTLFLDEIDALPLTLQGKLLTALEAKRVRRLGAVREQAVDVKLIAAAQTELSGAVQAGRFRADLYHRLAVVVLTLPPLRARGEDVLVLAQAYVQRYAAAHRVHPKRLSPAAEAWLRGHTWPGNVRELSHLLERVTLLSPEPILDVDTLVQLSLPPAEPIAPTGAKPSLEADQPPDEATRIRQALQAVGGNMVRAARLLGLSRSGLRYRMQRHGITPATRGTGPSWRTLQVMPAPPPRSQDTGKPPPVNAPASAPGWEQKPVVVLAIDLVFPTTVGSEALPVEPWTAAHRWEQAIGEKVRGFGGILLQRLSSLLIVAFGVPRALEQLPQRAVQAALAIRQLVTDAHAEANAPVPEVRQAVHLGSMLVETQAGAPAGRYQAEGETLSVAVRLLGRAGPGELWVSPEVGRLVAGWCELQAHDAPSGAGHSPPTTAYCVAGLVPGHSSRIGLGARPLSRFVGRAREVAWLCELLAQVEGGRGQVVGIVGEPGVGKSRLVYEFTRAVQTQGRASWYARATSGRCSSWSKISSGPTVRPKRSWTA
jgi:two-component system response regulator AtoC